MNMPIKSDGDRGWCNYLWVWDQVSDTSERVKKFYVNNSNEIVI